MDTNFVSSDMIRGHIDTIILLSLSDDDKHSNEIREEIEKKADGKYQVKQGTFYSALQRLSKQGLITEYRSSAKDSIRRKYFHLTEKGRKYVEDNISQWNYSRSVINNMIFNENVEPEKEIKTETVVINEIQYEFDKLVKEDISDYVLTEKNDDLNDYFDSLNETLKELTPPPVYEENLEPVYNEENDPSFTDNDENEVFEEVIENNDNTENVTSVEENQVKKFYELSTEKEFEENEIQEENIELDETNDVNEDESASAEIQEKISIENTVDDVISVVVDNSEESLLNDSTTDEVNVNEKTDNVNSTRDVFDLELEVLSDEKPEEVAEEKVDVKEEAPDNSYVNSDEILFGKSEEKEMYDSILEKLFPKRNQVPLSSTPSFDDKRSIETTVVDVDEENESEAESNDKTNVKVEPVYTKSEVFNPTSVSSTRKNNSGYNYPPARNEKFDYTDVLKLARQEGFKVRASNSTSMPTKEQKIFINKLNLHASLLFFIGFILEMLVLFLTIKFNQGFSIWFYVISLLAFSCVPIIFWIIYLKNKNKTVSNINKFRDSIEVVFIIALNLILLICAIAIISDINFYSAKDLLKYLIIPIIYVLNLPLFFIIKYVLLEKNGYFN